MIEVIEECQQEICRKTCVTNLVGGFDWGH